MKIRYEPAAASTSRASKNKAAAAAAIAGGLTLIIRLALHTSSFDLFGDEVVYTDLGRSVINGGFPRFGGPFFLHGPGFFYMEAGWARLVGSPHTLMGWIYQMRALNAVLAAVTGVAVVLLGTRAASLRAGIAAGLMFALDPFCIRQNDRVLLETAMMMWVMLGYLVFTSLTDRPASRSGWLRAVAAGLLFGCAILTKDEAALLTMLPLLVAAALRWGPTRSLSLLTLATTAAVYIVYLVLTAVNGYFGVLWQAKTAGIQRMLGAVQTTGFHSSGGGSLVTRLIAEGAYFATTYLALALAVAAMILVLRRGTHVARLMGLLYCAAALALGYAVTLGTLEEQELYLLIVPSLLIIPVAGTLLGTSSRGRMSRRSRTRSTTPLGVVLATALTLDLAINLLTCVQWFRQPDDGFYRLIQFMNANVPAGTRVGALDVDIETPYSLGNRYDVGQWTAAAALSAAHARYLVVEWAPVNQGYSDQTAEQVRRLVANDRLAFSFNGRTYGELALYQLPTSGEKK